ncbi:hypothetical protein C6P45_002904 [Maudiozyma exigua]|uniref:Peptidase A1 domain-containing protein n=1 Tax=Maudiozyma exigua TaxID=34358 RepID=A0A9P6VWA9_MAUEX|nr:hypothetical protein C6P45_002904 [Kazachstania exigua]
MEVGTPAQELNLIIDTGSADLWVMDSTNKHCIYNSFKNITVEPIINCADLLTFNSSESSTIKKVSDARFYINYVDLTYAEGIWVTDTITINGVSIPNMQFGLASNATTPVSGVLGIGFQRREAVRGYDGAPNEFYPNFPQVLKQEGITDVVAYSLNLGDPSSIVFGGLDTNAYTGTMYTFPMVNVYQNIVDKPATLALTIQGLDIVDKVANSKQNIFNNKYAVLLDSGTTLVSFPTDLADSMANFVNATYSASESVYIFNCPTNSDLIDFVFNFGDLKLEIPLTSFLLLPEGDSVCGFGVLRSRNSFITLGDSFLKNAYVVYDLDNYQISLAKAANNTHDQQNILEIPSDGKIPGALMAEAELWTGYTTLSTSTVKVASTIPSTTIGREPLTMATSGRVVIKTVTKYTCNKSF